MNTKVVPFKDSTLNKKDQVEQMFDEIAPKYDFLNHTLSLGIDKLWRKKAIQMIANKKPQSILDVATGTGDFAIDAANTMPECKIKGIDISGGMLEIGIEKIKQKKLNGIISLSKEDSEKMSFSNNQFDITMCAFGVRNFENLDKGLAEMYRVTKTGGNICVLEFSKPTSFPFKPIFNFYFRYILPSIGKLFSKSNTAYSYLPESVKAFPQGEDFLKILQTIGYKNATCKPLSLGIASIYFATK